MRLAVPSCQLTPRKRGGDIASRRNRAGSARFCGSRFVVIATDNMGVGCENLPARVLQSVNQDMNSDCRRSAIPRASSLSRIMSTLWRRSIQGEIALRKHDFISFLRPPYRSDGAHRMVSLVVRGPY